MAVNKEVSVQETPKATALAAVAAEFDAAPSGLDEVSARDVMVPRLAILQALSPQVTKTKPEFIQGAEQGDFCDIGTGDIFKGSMEVLPCFFATIYLEWAPRDSGKGLAANHGTNASVVGQAKANDNNQLILPNGNLIQETATYFVLNLSAGGRRSFIPLAATQIRSSRRWMTLITAEKIKRADGSEFTPPIYYRSWKATPLSASNAKGTWWTWKFEPSVPVLDLDPSKVLLGVAKEFCQEAPELAKSQAMRAAQDDNHDNKEVM